MHNLLNRLNVQRMVRLGINKCNQRWTSQAPQECDISQMVRGRKIVIFIKGTPSEPICAFSSVVVQLFQLHGVPFDYHNVFGNEKLYRALTEYSRWATLPQIFMGGKFIGGSEAIVRKHKSGQLLKDLKKLGMSSKWTEDMEPNYNN